MSAFKSSFWRRSSRYYLITLQRDLFGEWILVRQWGSSVTKGFQEKVTAFNNFESAQEAFDIQKERRKKHHYDEIT